MVQQKTAYSQGSNTNMVFKLEAAELAVASTTTQQTCTVMDWGELEEKATSADSLQAETLCYNPRSGSSSGSYRRPVCLLERS